MALMAAHGVITPMPDAAIFADTQAEPQSVYLWLDWLEKQLPFPVYRVTIGSLEKRAITIRQNKTGGLYVKTDIPFYVLSADGSKGKVTIRQCTYDFKVRPIRKKQMQLAGIGPREKCQHVVSWMGISLDEAHRMRDSRDAWSANRYPLVELRMKRADCKRWLSDNGFPQAPRSACVFCPFHNDREWRQMKDEEPSEFERAVRFEAELQRSKAKTYKAVAVPYLHRSLVKLADVDFSTAEERGQTNLFGNECEGMCGV